MGGLNKRGGPTDNLNIYKREGSNNRKEEGGQNVLAQNWQPV